MKKILIGIFISASLQAEPLSQPVLERYERMLVKTPEPGAAFDKIYQHYLESEGLDALAKHWREAAEANGAGKAGYLLLLGLLNDRRGQAEEALKDLREAADAGPGWRTWSALATVEGRGGKLADAVEDYKKAIALNPPPDAVAKMYRGLALSQQRLMDYAGAVETWRAYAKASPGDAFVLEEAGDALLEAGRFDEAKEMFTRLREQKEADPARKLNASLRLAEVERQQGNKDAALKIYNEALAEAGTASWLQREVRERIERLFRSDDDLPGLARYYGERLKAEPGDLEASLRLSETLGELNRDEEALKVLQAAAEKAPDNKDVQLKLSAALLKAERPAEAETVLAVLAKVLPDDTSVVAQLGEAQWQTFKLGKGNKETALATWRKLAPDGADANAVQQLAEIFRAHDLKEETLAEYRRALAADPSANDRRERLAEYLMALDRKDEAMTELQGLVTDGRASGENYLRLAKTQRRFGDDAAAQKSLEDAVEFPDRAFERQYLRWQIVSEKKNWEEAEELAAAMRGTAETDPEIERADDCLVQVWQEQKKTEGEIRGLLDRQKAEPGKFTERDWRLLFILAANGDDRGSAEFALGEGLKQFPKSASLAKLENAWARRNDDTDRRIASLKRLEEIEPQRAGDWKAERVRAYRDAENWDEAIKLAQECVQLSPAKAETHLLLADTLLAAQKPDEAIAALQEAVRLSENPNQVRLRLADVFTTEGKPTEAREAIEEAFEAEESPQGKLQLTGRLAMAYLQEGKIEELIAKLRSRQKAEQGGWRYALYLAEVYQVMQDGVHAMEEMDKALAGKPDDPTLLRKLSNLAEMTGDTEAVLRYARKIAEVAPSKENRAELGEALANDGKLDEALALLKDNSAEFLEDPSAWQEVIRQLQTEDKIGDLSDMLEGRLRANPNDWRSLMAMAEIFMGAGDTKKAGELLWRVMAIKEDPSAQAPVPPAPSAPVARSMVINGQVMMLSSGGGIYPSSQIRQMRFNESYQRAMQILANNPDNPRQSSRSIRMRFGGMMAQSTSTSTLESAQDDAIVYLACLAVRNGGEEAFVQKLAADLHDQPMTDRLAIYGMLQSPELIVREIEKFVESGDKDPKATQIAFQNLQSILANRRANATIALGDYSEDQLKALMEKLSAGLAQGTSPQDVMQRYQVLNMLGKKEEADKIVDELLKGEVPSDPAQLYVMLHFALQRKDYDRAIALNEKLKELRQKGGTTVAQSFQSFGLGSALLASEKYREKGIDLIAEDFVSPSPQVRGFPMIGMFGMGMGGRQQITWPQLRGGNMGNLLPLPTRDLNQQQVMFLRSISSQNPQVRDAVPDIIKRFAVLAKSKDSASLRQGAIWLQWFSGNKKEAEAAMKALIEEQPADDLLVNYSLMLVDSKKQAEALKVLDQVQARAGDSRELADRLRFAIALDSKDETAAKEAALKLASSRLVDYEQSQLVQEMKRLGLKDEAEKLQKKTAASRAPGQRSRQMVEVMNERMEAGNREEALALALALLGRDPFSRTAQNDRYQQEQALRALKKFGELDNYIAKLKGQLDTTPQSARLNARMAQAMQVKERKLAEPYYRKLAELRPKDTRWLQQLGELLTQSEQFDEAMRLYDRILVENPAMLFSQGTNFLEPYRRTKNWKRLVDAIAKSPDPVPDPLNPYRQNYSNVFMEIGRNLQQARPPVDPTDVWLKGLRWDQSGAWQLRPSLAQSLMRAGRADEARTVIEEAFFPPGRDESSARVFVYNRQFSPNALWSQTIMRGNGVVESPAVRLLRTAGAMGFLDELLPRLKKMKPAPDGSDPALLSRIVARDESVLPEIRKKIAEAKAVKPGASVSGAIVNMNTWRILADELADWPKGREVAVEALEAALKVAEVYGGMDFHSRMGLHLQLAGMAREDGRTEAEQKALKDWVAAQNDWIRQGAQMDFMTGLRVMKMMSAVGMEKEAVELAKNLRADRNFGRNTTYQRMLDEAENEIAINAGKDGDVTAVLAWTPGEGGGTLLWDLRPGGGSDDNGRSVWVADQPLRKVSGKYSLDIYFGRNQNSMKRLFSKAGVAARGTWSGKLPEGQGYLRAFLRKGEEVLMGPSVPAAGGVSLLAAQSLDEIVAAKNGVAKGWASIPPVPIVQLKGGPAAEGKFIRFDGDQQNRMELIAERIAIDPKKNYLAGCWFRYPQNEGSVSVGWRIYDKNGKELTSSSASGNFQGDRWNYGVCLFGKGSNSSGLPDKAAWLEPYLEFNGQVDIQGIFVTEIERPDSGD
jgi:tetratricopeptide (TPR) repeat protein